MEWLNYHHLLYFWMVAREGGLAQASAKLHLAQPTLSGQIHALEGALGEKLFTRSGRKLVLTSAGRVAYRYADAIFSLGQEMLGAVRGEDAGRPLRLSVGIVDAVPKLIARKLLEPTRHLEQEVRLVCFEGRLDQLVADLAVYKLDAVLSDSPVSPSSPVRAFNHPLGSCGVTFFATPEMREAHRKGFPRSLHGAPLLLPTESTMLRRSLDQWLSAAGIRPNVVAEFEDSALMKAFGQDGIGIFPGSTAIEDAIQEQYKVQVVGRTTAVEESYYAITVERRINHPGVVAMCEAARQDIFRSGPAA
ncbi:MAG: transcriptional activator NhaR [Polyangiaceae bacterium]|nr:transcriptional activator NhaR [Polyangiaceae bacterium]NUQ73591.1 transcriptional activator NhaR [Polyangiaceae bacterium]